MLEVGDGRVGEEFEIVVRQAVGVVDHRRPLRLDPDPHPGARQRSRRNPEERSVGGVKEADDAGIPPPSSIPLIRDLRRSSTGMPESVRKSFTPKAGRDADHHLARVGTNSCRAHAAKRQAALDVAGKTASWRHHGLLVEDIANPHDFLAARRRQPVARAGAEVVVGIIHGMTPPCRPAPPPRSAGNRRRCGASRGRGDFRLFTEALGTRALMTSRTVIARALIASEMRATSPGV